MDITVAASAGFCMGVAGAVRTVYEKMQNTKLVTYGPLVHNKTVTGDLARHGVRIVHSLDEVRDETVVIRSHGAPPSLEAEMKRRHIPYIDCTCACIKTVHRFAAKCKAEGRVLLIAGDATHPEIIGVAGYAGAIFYLENENDAIQFIPENNKLYAIAAQTTFERVVFERILAALQAKKMDLQVRDTICDATRQRQAEAESIAAKVDYMIVLGDKTSANTSKLYGICKKNCDKTILLETIHDLQLRFFANNVKIGLTAGASTPPAITKEAIQFMSDYENTVNEQVAPIEQDNSSAAGGVEPASETPVEAAPVNASGTCETETQPEPEAQAEAKPAQSFEEMLNESFITLHTGDVVKGTVIHVSSGEVTINLGYKSDGIITRAEMTDDPAADITQMVKPGDVMDVYVLRVNDGDGNVLVSKKRLDAQTNYKIIEQAFNDKTPIAGKVVEVVKGGLIVSMHGNRVFVPSSQISNRYVEDLTVFKGKEFNFNILEFDRSKRRIVAGRKELAAIEQQQRRDELFASLEIGQKLEGTVSRIVDFGAFVDLGGVDGLIHISELAWRRVRRVTDVLQAGDTVTVTVIDVNPEKNKISLTLKDVNNNPWNNISEKYTVGSIVEGKVVRMATFGAFIMLEDGVDGLAHISQLANRHIAKPEEVLSVGDIVKVKITDIDENNRKISLSKREADAELGIEDEPVTDAETEEVVPEEAVIAEAAPSDEA